MNYMLGELKDKQRKSRLQEEIETKQLLSLKLKSNFALLAKWILTTRTIILEHFSLSNQTDSPYETHFELRIKFSVYSEEIFSADIQKQVLRNNGETPEDK